jgi:hypothetical protein
MRHPLKNRISFALQPPLSRTGSLKEPRYSWPHIPAVNVMITVKKNVRAA